LLPIVSVVVPTRNEASNIEPLVKRLDSSLADYPWELIFVDDSDDSTPDEVRRLAATNGHLITMLHREPGRRSGGLGGAVKEGFELTRGQVIVVMDADLQHPPEIVPALVAPVLGGRFDLVAGNRYGAWGSRAGLDGPFRHLVALGCRWLAHRLVPESAALADPMSGLFALDRSVVEKARLAPDGYKILLEVVAKGNWRNVHNVEYNFNERYSGRSKAGLREGLVFLRHLLRLALRARHGKRDGRRRRGPGPRENLL
jgi:glycosyltransferase involved in cell wall biosynthesis